MCRTDPCDHRPNQGADVEVDLQVVDLAKAWRAVVGAAVDRLNDLERPSR